MSAGLWVRDSAGVSRKIKKLYTNVGGVTRELKELWVNDAGVARKIYEYVPPITWTYTTSDTFSYSKCTFSSGYTLKADVLHTKDFGTKGVDGSCMANYLFSSPISVTSTDYLLVSSLTFSSNSPRDSIYLSVSVANGGTPRILYNKNQKTPNLQNGDKIQFNQNMSFTGISVVANMRLYGDDPDYYPHASIQLDLSVHIQGIDGFWLSSQGHN